MSYSLLSRALVPILGCVIFPQIASSATADPAPAPAPDTLTEIRDALTMGKVSVYARYRYENVDQETFTKKANASTVRTAIGYETKSYKGLSAFMQFEGVFDVGNDNYNSTVNGKTTRPTVVDAPTVEVNQAWIRYICPEDKWKTTLTYGRSEILLGNQRLVGNVGWRQDHQNFDGAGISTTPLNADGKTLSFGYDYLSRVNRIFPQGTANGRVDMETHLVQGNFGIKDIGSLLLYGLFLDYDSLTPAITANSSSTVGGRLSGALKATDVISVLYGAEYASQSDYGTNTNTYDAAYYQVEAGVGISSFSVKIGYQVMEGESATKKFTTPLATGHAFDGWADLFLNTPNAGLETTSLTVSWAPPMIKGLKLLAVGHSFSGESISDHFGNEIDLLAEYMVPQVKGLLLGVKAAFFDGDETTNMTGANATGLAAEEVTKFWVYTQFAF
jgi:hypothetical protein